MIEKEDNWIYNEILNDKSTEVSKQEYLQNRNSKEKLIEYYFRFVETDKKADEITKILEFISPGMLIWHLDLYFEITLLISQHQKTIIMIY